MLGQQTSPDYLVKIVGPHKLQNELMAGFLEKEAGIKCESSPERKKGSSRAPSRPQKPNLILVDCQGADDKNIWIRLENLASCEEPACLVALFNVSRGLGIEKKAVERGIRGVFRENDPKELFPKGVLAILQGELWFSRETLAEYVIEAKNSSRRNQDIEVQLTPREKEILISLAAGASNEEIAEDLGISPHTVKTHIYNLYQKISVPNRLQAALWAANNL